MKYPGPAGLLTSSALTTTGWKLGNGLECIPRQWPGGRSCYLCFTGRTKSRPLSASLAGVWPPNQELTLVRRNPDFSYTGSTSSLSPMISSLGSQGNVGP